MNHITSPVILSKQEKKSLENKSYRDRLKLDPEKAEAVKNKVHENYTNRKAAETSDDKENRLKSNRDYKRRKLKAMTAGGRKYYSVTE